MSSGKEGVRTLLLKYGIHSFLIRNINVKMHIPLCVTNTNINVKIYLNVSLIRNNTILHYFLSHLNPSYEHGRDNKRNVITSCTI